ncbi:DNA-3-methyladenine glycosylase 2 family protein [Georgenia sp. Z1491]|uniref:DNA-3-methyladenine glycosylase 2 family protein n=1 Tax=Georgenia sp. Z1491 TaxID=3416707 RepID=UPI003CF70741
MSTAIDDAAAYAACSARDPRWDGRVYLGVTSTGVYCRPSCPARMPRRENCRFFRTAASAATAGFRACRRCRPDTLPGRRAPGESPELVERALAMIAGGVVDEVGVPGLAARLGLQERRLHRMLTAELGAGALALARTRRAQTARTLLEQTDLPVTDVAFAAGFASVRQFNDVVRAELGASPTQVRARAPRSPGARGRGVPRGASWGADGSGERVADGAATLTLRLRVRPPFDGPRLAASIAQHAVDGVETVTDVEATATLHAGGTLHASATDVGATARLHAAETLHASATLHAAGGPARVSVELSDLSGGGPKPWDGDRAHVAMRADLTDLADLPAVVARVRRWLDLDAEPVAVADHLGSDPLLAPLVAARPGLRVQGSVDAFRTLIVAILGQQVSLAATRTFAGRLVGALGEAAPWRGSVLTGASVLGEATGGSPMAPDDAGAAGPSPAAASGAVASPADARPAGPASTDVSQALLFPTPEALAAAGPEAIREAVRIPAARARTVHRAAELVAGGLDLGPGADGEDVRAALLDVSGIGPWTVDLLELRGLGDTDALPPGDLVLRRALGRLLGTTPDPSAVTARAKSWRPWRAYATTHLWTDEMERP